jgi:putative Mg2+ transporter-C (MgtC) family protein
MTFLYGFGTQLDAAQLRVAVNIGRLVLAAFLGGVIGVERELRHKAAGLRTQMFVCLGSAFFTILSSELAGVWGGDHTRIAAQIIPGIGFIGAGTILHARGSVTGLSTAATLFVVASIGMAAGGGLYVLALLVSILVLLALFLLGWLEIWLSIKTIIMTYDVFGPDLEQMLATVNQILEAGQQTMSSVQFVRSGHSRRLQFTISARSEEHRTLLDALRTSVVFDRVQSTTEAGQQ